MLATVVFAALCALGAAQDAGDRVRAEQLARAGHSKDAIQLWERIAASNPADLEARIWVGRLQLRLGDADAAESTFRDVLAAHPSDVDARIGLANALIRKGTLHDALTVLYAAERDAAGNAELLATLARAFRRAGNDRYALYYFTRAVASAPDDPDIVDGYERLVRAYGGSVSFEGFGQDVAPGTRAASGRLVARFRVTPRLHVLGQLRAQQGEEYADRLLGGGLEWRVGHATVTTRLSGGRDNVALPHADWSGGVIDYAGAFEIGGEARELSFLGVGVTTLSPTVAWDRGGRFRLDTRYTYSSSRFAASGERRGDNSAVVRGTVRPWRRVSLNGVYAYGIESFEDLTADRLSSLAAHTGAAGLRISLRSLSTIDGTWEHQWRSNGSALDRVTISFSQFFP